MLSMQRITYHTNIPELKDFMENLPDIFSREGKTIKSGRNKIKIIEYGGVPLCVKSFIKVSVFNRIMYSWFRATKAKRSFQIAEKLIKKGIETPFPMGYAEVTGKGGMIRTSFYVSAFLEHEWMLGDVLPEEHPEGKQIISEYARFMAKKVHPAGVWHKDMSNGNVLINRYRSEYSFALIDLNRTRFKKKIKPEKGLHNLRRHMAGNLQTTILAEQYALASNRDPKKFVSRLFRSQVNFESRRKRSKKILHSLNPMQKEKK